MRARNHHAGFQLCAAAFATVAGLGACAGADDSVSVGALGKDAVLAPAGIVIGMPLSDAEAAALAAGFVRTTDCRYSRTSVDGKMDDLMLQTGEAIPCEAGAPVRMISHHGPAEAESPAAAIDDVAERLKAKPACRALLSSMAQCAWNKPASYPLAHVIDADIVGSTARVTIRAVKDLSKPNSYADPYPASFDPLTPIGETGALAPGGIAIGAKLEDVNAALIAAGFEATGYNAGAGMACAWVFERKYEVTVKIQIRADLRNEKTGGVRTACMPGAIVRHFEYQKTDFRPDKFERAPSAKAATVAWKRELAPQASEESCVQRPGSSNMETVECKWAAAGLKSGVEAATVRFQSRPTEHSSSVYLLVTGPKAQ